MQGLLRLAGWGVAATAALLLAVIAANSSSGQERLSSAFAGRQTAPGQARSRARLTPTEQRSSHGWQQPKRDPPAGRNGAFAGRRSRAADDAHRLARAQSRGRHRFDQAAGRIGASGGNAAADRARGGPATDHHRRTAQHVRRQATPPSEPAAAPPKAEPPDRTAKSWPARQRSRTATREARPAVGVDLGGARRFRRAARALEHHDRHPSRLVRRTARRS